MMSEVINYHLLEGSIMCFFFFPFFHFFFLFPIICVTLYNQFFFYSLLWAFSTLKRISFFSVFVKFLFLKIWYISRWQYLDKLNITWTPDTWQYFLSIFQLLRLTENAYRMQLINIFTLLFIKKYFSNNYDHCLW